LAGDEKHAWVCPIVIAFAATGGTNLPRLRVQILDELFSPVLAGTTLKN
jgi:hypothetical protein